MVNTISIFEHPLVLWLWGTQLPSRNSTKKEFKKQPKIQPSTDRLKAEPQILPQVSPNLDVCPDPEKGKKWEPWKQKGGLVKETRKMYQHGRKSLRFPPSVTSKFAELDESFRRTFVSYGIEHKIPEVPYYIRVTPTKTNKLKTCAQLPRLPLKAEPQILPQISPNLDVCLDPEKGKKWEPRKQKGGLVEETRKSYQQGIKRLRFPPSVTSKFAELDERRTYVSFGKQDKIPEVPYYSRVTPTKTNKLKTSAQLPRLPLKAEPQILPQVSPNLDVCLDPKKGKKCEPSKQKGGLVEDILKSYQQGIERLRFPPSVTSKFAELDERHTYVSFGKQDKIPEVPYYIRVTPTRTNKLKMSARLPRLPLKAEPQILPQISSNLDVCPDHVKGKKGEPWKQNGGFVEEILHNFQQGTKRLCLSPSDTSKFAEHDGSFRHNINVRYGKEEKIPEVACYIRVTPTKTNKLMTCGQPPRDPFRFTKVKPTLLPRQNIATEKAESVPEKEVVKKGPENEKDSAEYYKQNTILQPELVTSLEDIPCHLLQSMSLEPTAVVTCLENYNSLECPVCTIEPHTNRLTEDMPVNLSHPQSTFSSSNPTNLDSQNPVTGHCHLLQSMSLEPTEVVMCLEDNNSLECPFRTIEPHTSELTDELTVNLDQPQSTLSCPSEPTNIDSQDPVTVGPSVQSMSLKATEVVTCLDNISLECHVCAIEPHILPQSTSGCHPEPTNLDSLETVTVQEQSILLDVPVCPAKPHTNEMLEELPVNSATVIYPSEMTLDFPTVKHEELFLIKQEGTPEQKQIEIENNQPASYRSLSCDPKKQGLPETEEKEQPGKADVVPKPITESQDLAVPSLQNKLDIKAKVERVSYDRNFLLQFKSITEEPKDFSEICKIHQGMVIRPHLRPVDPSQLTRRNWTPQSANSCYPSKGNRRLPPGIHQMRSPQAPVKEHRRILELNENVKLQKCEKAWRPPMKRATEDPSRVKAEELFRKVRGILNKITPQTFEHLIHQVKDLSVDTEHQLKGVAELIFEKAVAEPHFAVIYANMCNWLMRLEVPTEENRDVCITFRRLLIRLCQVEFERREKGGERIEELQKELEATISPNEKARIKEELSDACKRALRRSLGNIKFIGELFKLKLLSEATIKDCLIKLLNKNTEESMECICQLLTSVGKHLENAQPGMDNYFNKLNTFIKNKTSSRIRFLVQDVLDLRKNNWVPRHKPEGPKTIDQIHKESEQESKKKVQ
ncbi:eukaryotic translation initiation factor 4 gamma 1 isoform X1 [Pelobates cultripes]|uniref:Eukaryotic translation initiation factor 4 gamma 1 isoform X1 n=1 Tax=Pelobates cultripes TaxID=61616 RepID=A0AAD1RHH1_PELCU|nr:eukaryotic translation initiation factor 4 gamma 1 isoform X1 [Pelobates cultripes]